MTIQKTKQFSFLNLRLNLRLNFILISFFLSCWASSYAQHDPLEQETDSAVLAKLDWWQDQKFGFMMHWGTYSQWGIVESWSLCSEDVPWCKRHIADYSEYCRQYKALKTTFNPTQFDPAKWAEAAEYAGMKYVVFTTKHHDGFSMFDTKQTEYGITDPNCPFSTHPKSNITKEVFDAFRQKGFGTGVYFSKADWNHPDYWAPEWAHPDRNVNYDPEKYPERWQRFKDFTYNQIEELMTDYGKVDILWLDGGWVRPAGSLTEETKPWLGCKGYIQDVDMPRIAAMARSYQPGMLVVDRTVHGRYENYRTPEQRVPAKALDYPWETCMTMANSWSFTPNDNYKSTHKLLHLLVDIVAKGGNFLLNVGPDANGNLAPEAYERLREIGDWMKVNGSAIYGSRPIAPYKEANICYTQLRDGTVNALYLADEGETHPPAKIMLHSICPAPGATVTLLGSNQRLKWEKVGKGALIYLPKKLQETPPCQHVWTIRVSESELLID